MQSMARVSSRYRQSQPSLDRTTLILLGVFVVLALATAVVAYLWARNLFSSWTMTGMGNGPAISSPAQTGEQNQENSNVPIPEGPLQNSGAGPEPKPWDGKTRVTVLVMGLDYRDCEDNFAECDQNGASRTDSMMLLTVDPVSKTAGMLSIPRDLWVQIPGFDYGKINTAYFLGEVYKLPDGGPGLAMRTVEQLLGVPIQYYALVDFNAFVRIIDELGGVKIRPKERIKLDPIGPNNTIWLDPGVYVVDGATALAYARNRYTEGGDFDRAARQQEVLISIRDRVLQFNMLPTLITKAPRLYAEVQSGVRTNLTLEQIIQLAWLSQQIDKENIKRGIIGPPDYVTFSTSPDGQAIEIPVTDQIRVLRDEIFATGGPVGPAAVTDDPEELVKQEAARILVKNGTTTEGLAGRTAEYLRSKGLNVTGEGNADQVYSFNTLIDYSGKPYTMTLLLDMLGKDNTRVISRYDPNAQVDIEIILGTPFAQSNPLP